MSIFERKIIYVIDKEAMEVNKKKIIQSDQIISIIIFPMNIW